MAYIYRGKNGDKYRIEDIDTGEIIEARQGTGGIFVGSDEAQYNGEEILGFPNDIPTTGSQIGASAGAATNLSANTSDDSLYNQSDVRQSRKYEPNKTEDDDTVISEGEAVRSKFNKWTLVNVKTHPEAGGRDDKSANVDAYQKGAVDSSIINPTAKTIVNKTRERGDVSLGYQYSIWDFAPCEHYGMISNNYMVTLRRFPYPAPDDIIAPKQFDSSGELIETQQPDLAKAITWMSPHLENDLSEIMGFSVGLNWKDVESEVQTAQGRSSEGMAGTFTNSTVGGLIRGGQNGMSATEVRRMQEKGAGWDPLSETFPNAVFGPLNVIKDMKVRDKGLNFEQDFTLNFHYDLKGFKNTSPKVAFLDVLSNMLMLTYNNAPFWGGAVRYTSNGIPGKPLGDYSKMRNGDYEGFLKSIGKDMGMDFNASVEENTQGALNKFKSMGSQILNGELGDSQAFKNVFGGALSGLVGGQQGMDVIQSMITGDPTGQWHLTIGNPLQPTMMIGNLALENADFSLMPPLGHEDFPTKLKVTVTLKHGRPRDKGEIESMFNAGKGRIYLQPEDGENPQDNLVNASAYGEEAKETIKNSTAAIQRTSNMADG
jgi:hypothetical protein